MVPEKYIEKNEFDETHCWRCECELAEEQLNFRGVCELCEDDIQEDLRETELIEQRLWED